MESLLKLVCATCFAVQPHLSEMQTKNWGLYNSVEHSHIHAQDSMLLTKGSHKVIVGILDTGIDPNHVELSHNIWSQTEQNIASFVYGWNFVTDTANPLDDHGHGTHIAGIIKAVSPKVALLPVKYYSDVNTGFQNLRNTVRAIRYAVDRGVNIINYSGGGSKFSEEEYLALKYAESKGVLVVAAAGNEHQDTDKAENYYYPASYRLKNIISVASVDIHNQLLPSSNWGAKRVDVAAPGKNIYSTLPGNRYGYMTGTSQATAFVSGVAAQLKACNPKLTYVQIKSTIMSTVDKVSYLKGKVIAGRRVNELAALQKILVKGRCIRR